VRSRPSSSQSLLGLAHPQPHANQCSCPGFGDPPSADHALLRAAGADREIDRVEKQHDQVDVIQRAATERRKPLMQLRAHPGHARARHLPEPGLLTQRLDIAHRQATHEPTDDQRLERVRPQQPLAMPLRKTASTRTAQPPREPAESRSAAHPQPSATAGRETRCPNPASKLRKPRWRSGRRT